MSCSISSCFVKSSAPLEFPCPTDPKGTRRLLYGLMCAVDRRIVDLTRLQNQVTQLNSQLQTIDSSTSMSTLSDEIGLSADRGVTWCRARYAVGRLNDVTIDLQHILRGVRSWVSWVDTIVDALRQPHLGRQSYLLVLAHEQMRVICRDLKERHCLGLCA